MAVKMIVVIVVFVFGGLKLDEYIPMDFPVATLVLSLAGVSLAMYAVTRDLLK